MIRILGALNASIILPLIVVRAVYKKDAFHANLMDRSALNAIHNIIQSVTHAVSRIHVQLVPIFLDNVPNVQTSFPSQKSIISVIV